MLMIVIKRAYDPPGRADGSRILVDRVWPRGIKRQELQINQWMREIGPSNQLRKFFGHDPARWEEFRRRYRQELESPAKARLLSELVEIARNRRLTLVYSAKDEAHNQAVVLKEVLEEKLGQR
jgi:uncharacterized protein YeaO (DUF488 family)